MYNKKIIFDKLFPDKHGVNKNNLHIDYECISYITVPKDSLKIVDFITQKLQKYNIKKENITIVDSTACVGGDTITFSQHFATVIPIELDLKRYNDLVNNINEYKLENVYPINGNCLDKIPEIQINFDCIYIDPPWGGSEYKYYDKIDIKLNNMDLDAIINSLFISNVKLIVLKLPKNYNYDNLLPKLKKYNVTLNREIKKIDILSIEKNL